MKALKLEQVLQFVNGELLHGINPQELNRMVIDDVCTDSRNVHETSLFVPLVGERFDGHDFIGSAVENGAKVFLCHKEVEPVEGCIFVKVEDTKKALGDLAHHYLRLFNVKVIGVTGSVGKTTCKDMIAACLSSKYKVLKTQGNFNNDIGLPLTVFNIEESHEVAILEMGMNHFGEIDYLSKIACPDYVIITNIGVSHIENLGSRKGICKAKCEIMNHAKKNALMLVNADDDFNAEICSYAKDKQLRVKTFGIKNEAQFMAKNITMSFMEDSQGLHARLNGDIYHDEAVWHLELSSIGKHLMYNLLPAVAIAKELQVSEEELVEGLNGYIPTERRLNVYKTGKNITIIDDVYNASPDSMKAALSTIMELQTQGRKIAILGDMLEMGDYAKDGHYEVGQFASKCELDLCITIGENGRYIREGFDEKSALTALYFETVEEANHHIGDLICGGDTILFKASRGMHFEEIIEKINEVTR